MTNIDLSLNFIRMVKSSIEVILMYYKKLCFTEFHCSSVLGVYDTTFWVFCFQSWPKMNKHNPPKLARGRSKSFDLNTNMGSPPFRFGLVKLLPQKTTNQMQSRREIFQTQLSFAKRISGTLNVTQRKMADSLAQEMNCIEPKLSNEQLKNTADNFHHTVIFSFHSLNC